MSSSSAAATFSLDHLSPAPSEQLCYVHCNFCDTVLAVSVPYTSLFKTVTVRCGHCSNLLNVNMRALHLPAPNQLHLANTTSFLSAPYSSHNNLLEEITCYNNQPSSMLMDQHNSSSSTTTTTTTTAAKESVASNKRSEESTHQTPAVNRPPEKRQRVPSAYNRFIKDEIQRIKAGNPDITHREAFSAAAKNWAHFPHIHFGLMPDQAMKKNNVRQQEHLSDHDMMLKDHGFYAAAAAAAAAANMGVTPF